MDAEPMREDWEVAFGSLQRPRYVQVPDEALEAFLRVLTERGIETFWISNDRFVFSVVRSARAPGIKEASGQGRGTAEEIVPNHPACWFRPE
ncbi:MAG TPA: hypothetical protein VF715_01320 [Thermoleophilaceae bacterium]|jgi:hypothetical protein